MSSKKKNYNKSCSHQEYTTVSFSYTHVNAWFFFFIFSQSDRNKMAHSAFNLFYDLSEAKGVFHIYWPFIISLVRIVS